MDLQQRWHWERGERLTSNNDFDRALLFDVSYGLATFTNETWKELSSSSDGNVCWDMSEKFLIVFERELALKVSP